MSDRGDGRSKRGVTAGDGRRDKPACDGRTHRCAPTIKD